MRADGNVPFLLDEPGRWVDARLDDTAQDEHTVVLRRPVVAVQVDAAASSYGETRHRRDDDAASDDVDDQALVDLRPEQFFRHLDIFYADRRAAVGFIVLQSTADHIVDLFDVTTPILDHAGTIELGLARVPFALAQLHDGGREYHVVRPFLAPDGAHPASRSRPRVSGIIQAATVPSTLKAAR